MKNSDSKTEWKCGADLVVAQLEAQMPGKIATGRFQTMMEVALVNSGPVTILLDSRKNF